MSIPQIQSGYSPAQTKFSGYTQQQPYAGIYGGRPVYYSQPVYDPSFQQQSQGTSTLTKLLIAGVVIGGSAFAFKKISPEYYSKALTLAETVTPDFIKSGYSSMIGKLQKHTPDFIKNGYETAASKAKNLFSSKQAEQAATGILGKAKNASIAVISSPYTLFKSVFSRG